MIYRFGLREAAAAACTVAGFAAYAQNLGYSDTPFLPGGKWRVHDGTRPQPKAIDPGTASSQESAGKAPSDAVVLFDGKDLSKWKNGNGPAKWKVQDGYFEVVRGTGTLETKEEFSGDCQLHVEFSSPNPPRGTSQGRGNSGVFLMGRYEIQVLDSYESKTYPDGQAASIYAQYPPLVNASRRPGEWQTYDILFTGPKFRDGKLIKPAYATVLHNGVVVHNHAELLGPMAHRVLTSYTPHGEKGPVGLQDHGDPVRFRNIWIRELKGYDQP
jgi:hypothetical protein